MLSFLKGYLAAGQIAAAAIAANLIALLAAPFITRLYSPSDFGVYSTFIALTFVDVVACLGYEKAVLAAREDSVSHRLLSLSVLSALFISAVVASVAFLWVVIGPRPSAAGMIIAMLLPASVLLVGILNAVFAICVRELRFAAVSVARIVQACLVVGVQLGAFALLLGGAHVGLVLGHVAGAAGAVTAALLMRGSRPHVAIAQRFRGAQALAREHAAYVSSVVPALLLNAIALQAPILLVGAIYDPATTGLFGLTQRIAGAPMALVGIAVGQVFAGRLSQLIRGGATGREVARFYFNTAGMMLVAGAVLVCLWFPAPYLFAVVFGAEWEGAGHIFRSLVPLYVAQIVVAPLQSVFFLVARHDLYWKSEAFRLLMVLAIFFAAVQLDLSSATTFLLLGPCGALGYVASAMLATRALRNPRLDASATGTPR